MAQRRSSRRRDSDDFDPLFAFFVLVVLSVGAFIYKHIDQVVTWGVIVGLLGLAAFGAYYFLKLRRRNAILDWDDDKILYMLKGMSPSQFEREMALMFNALGFDAEAVGGSNDGGIDVIAQKGGKRYFVQCKKFMTREVTPHDVRDFLGAITNVSNPADKGYFITTNKFTLAAEQTAEGNPRIELIDGARLVGYYKMAYGKEIPETLTPSTTPMNTADSTTSRPSEESETCPKCNGKLIPRKGRYGAFLGCSNYPKCRYTQKL